MLQSAVIGLTLILATLVVFLALAAVVVGVRMAMVAWRTVAVVVARRA
jgi:hypothetical protein